MLAEDILKVEVLGKVQGRRKDHRNPWTFLKHRQCIEGGRNCQQDLEEVTTVVERNGSRHRTYTFSVLY